MNYSFVGIQITTINKPWKFIQVPEKLIQIAGYTKKDIADLFENSFYKTISEQDSARIETEIDCQLKLGDSFTLEYEITSNIGESIHLTYVGNHLVLDGKSCLCGGVYLTPTSLSLEEYYRNILDCLPTPVFIADSGMTISFLNQAAQQCSGLSFDDYQGKPWELLNGFLDNIPDFFSGHFRSDALSTTLVASNGQTYQAVLSSIKEPNGKNKGYICVFINITQLKETENLLRLTEEDYRTALVQNLSSIWEYNVASNTIHQTSHQANAAAEYNIGTKIENIPDSFLELELVPPEFLDELRAMYQKIRSGEKYVEATTQIFKKNGSYRWIHVNCTTIFDKNGQPLKAIGVSKDITEQKKLEEQYQQECRYRDSLISNAMSAYEVDLTENRIIRLDNEWSTILGLNVDVSYNHLLEKVIEKAVYSRHRQEVLSTLGLENLLASYYSGKKDVSCDYLRLDASGDTVWVRCTVYLTLSATNNHIIAIIYIKDINEQKKHELELQKKADRDPLTGLLNRNASLVQIENALFETAKNDEISVMFMIDIDNFKQVNDTYGHIAGDTVLREMAKKLSTFFRKEDILGRIGGDEFIVFLSNIPGKSTALEKATQICHSMNNVYFLNSRQCTVSCSVGIAFAPFHGNSFDTLYEKADTALYHSKNQGKNQYSVYRDGLSKINLDLKKATEIEHKMNSSFSGNLTDYIFKILFNSNNTEDSITSALQILSSHFSSERAYILEYSEFHKCLFTKFESSCCSITKNRLNIPLSDLAHLVQLLDEDGIYTIMDTNLAPDSTLKSIITTSNAQSAIFCAIIVSSELRGFLVMELSKPSQLFSLELRDTFKLSTEIIGMFIQNIHRSKEYENYLDGIQTVLKNTKHIAYVVNPNNHRLVFMNKKCRTFFPGISLGDKCYSIFHNLEHPCDDCPINELFANKKACVSFEMYNEMVGILLSFESSLISWPDGGEYCLMNCNVADDKFKSYLL